MTDYKTKAFQENIKFLKEAYDKGTITRNEIRDNERSIRLIQFGKDCMLEKVKDEINLNFSSMEALLRHRFEDSEYFEEIIEEIFNYKDELIKSIKKLK